MVDGAGVGVGAPIMSKLGSTRAGKYMPSYDRVSKGAGKGVEGKGSR